MYARSSTVRGNPQFLDDAVDYLRNEVMPALQEMDGFVGMSTMCDRDSGRAVATTAWKTEEAMHASEGALYEMRRRYAEIVGGRPEVQEWEIAVLHRLRPAPEGAGCRVVWTRGDPADTDRAVEMFRTTVLPRVEELPGFCSVSMLVDRETGRAVVATVYESREAMFRAVGSAKSMREEFVRQVGSEITELAELDVGLAHFRVPETI